MSGNGIAVPNADQLVKPRRIDGPHSVSVRSVEHSPALVAELAGVGAGATTSVDNQPQNFLSDPVHSLDDLLELDESPEARAEQLEAQASQLASQLQEQLRELEHREALQNAQAAELDNELRRARLWMSEKGAELAEREKGVAANEVRQAVEKEEALRQLAQQRQSASSEVSLESQQCQSWHIELESRQAVLVQREQELVQRQQVAGEQAAALGERMKQIEVKENQVRERRQAIEREAAALHHARLEWERSHEEEQAELASERATIREELAAELSHRAEALDKGEALLAEQARELENDREALSQERTDWARQRTAEQEAIVLEQHRATAALEQRRARLTSRESALDQQQAAIEQLRGEITLAHRQSLEMRLMAEQLWGQVQGRMPPAEITQSIAQLRMKLAEQYRQEQQGLREQQEELLGLAERVAQESGVLRTQRQELQSWFAAREQEIERHAKSLVERECELLEQSDQLRAIETGWNSDRRQLERELREMRSRLRQEAA